MPGSVRLQIHCSGNVLQTSGHCNAHAFNNVHATSADLYDGSLCIGITIMRSIEAGYRRNAWPQASRLRHRPHGHEPYGAQYQGARLPPACSIGLMHADSFAMPLGQPPHGHIELAVCTCGLSTCKRRRPARTLRHLCLFPSFVRCVQGFVQSRADGARLLDAAQPIVVIRSKLHTYPTGTVG